MELTIPLKVEIDENQLEKAIENYMEKNPDIVEVVRCKDCKHYNNGECAYHSEPKEMRMYERWTVDVDDNDYCSCGERRENDT